MIDCEDLTPSELIFYEVLKESEELTDSQALEVIIELKSWKKGEGV